jgi:CheY-like chemotaxis protein
MNEDRPRSHEAGFSEHLVKPIDVPQLIATIRRASVKGPLASNDTEEDRATAWGCDFKRAELSRRS